MSKRFNNGNGLSTKKSKVDDLWGEDLDNDVIENCFQLASQVYEQDDVSCTQKGNITLLPTYSAFKQPKCTSTQLDTSIGITEVPSTSKQADNIDRLRDECAEKTGEVSVLRLQLKEVKHSAQIEQQKKQTEWLEKQNKIEREMKSVKSELEFKNLEISNLKSRIFELSKSKQKTFSTNLVDSTNKKLAEKDEKFTENPSYSISTHTKLDFPLATYDLLSLFNTPLEENLLDLKQDVNFQKSSFLFLQNKMSKREQVLVSAIQELVRTKGKSISFDYIQTEVTELVKFDRKKLNSLEISTLINKIICVTMQLLTDFRDYLKIIEDNCQLQDIQEADWNYIYNNEGIENFLEELTFDNNEWGIRAGKLLHFISELLQFNNYLNNYIFNGKINKTNCDFFRNFPIMSKNEPILSIILDIIKIIGRTRNVRFCSGFLYSVTYLLINVFKNGNESNDLINKIIKELVFARPDYNVFYRIIELFKWASQSSIFVEFLCSRRNPVMNSKSEIRHFNNDSCTFYIFASLFENLIMKIQLEHLPLVLTENVISFVYNLFYLDTRWLFPEKKCECLCLLYKISVHIIYKTIEKYKLKESGEEYKLIFKNSLQVLSLLKFNSELLIEKYVSVYGEYEEILNFFKYLGCTFIESNTYDLESLNLTNELPVVPPDCFGDDF